MRFDEDLEELLDRARTTVEKFIADEGAFPLFALAQDTEGEVSVVACGEGFTTLNAALGELLKELIPMARDGRAVATVICSPIPEDVAVKGWCAVVFDVESRDGTRIYGILPYRKHDYQGWQYGTIEYSRGKPQLFAR